MGVRVIAMEAARMVMAAAVGTRVVMMLMIMLLLMVVVRMVIDVMAMEVVVVVLGDEGWGRGCFDVNSDGGDDVDGS